MSTVPQLSTKERNIQRFATLNGMKNVLIPLIQQRLALEPLNIILADPMINGLLSSAEKTTGFSIRIIQEESGNLNWVQTDLSEDALFSVKTSSKQLLRASVAGVQLEMTVSQTDKASKEHFDVRDRTTIVLALRRMLSVMERFDSEQVLIPDLAEGKRYRWDISDDGPIMYIEPTGPANADQETDNGSSEQDDSAVQVQLEPETETEVQEEPELEESHASAPTEASTAA